MLKNGGHPGLIGLFSTTLSMNVSTYPVFFVQATEMHVYYLQ